MLDSVNGLRFKHKLSNKRFTMKKSLVMVALAVLSIGACAYWANANVTGGCCHKHEGKTIDSGFKCTFCKGTGWQGDFTCFACKGSGRDNKY